MNFPQTFKQLGAVILTGACLGLPMAAQAQWSSSNLQDMSTQLSQIQTHEKRLPNGLKILVRQDKRAPVAVVQLWYRVGSVDEFDTISGVSHALEHMMFRGTSKVKDGEYAKTIARLGGKQNAFTSQDATVYFAQIAKEHVGDVLRLEADRMRHLRLQPELFAKEIQVIREERRQRTDDQPLAFFMEQMRANAWQVTPSRQPIIGWASDIERMNIAHLQDWYRRWYQPQNATLVVVGDVVPADIFAKAAQYFGKLQNTTDMLPQRSRPLDPPQAGLRDFVISRPSELAYLGLAWQVPKLELNAELLAQMENLSAGKQDFAKLPESLRDVLALRVLSFVLDGVAASRLPKKLVREQALITAVSAHYDGLLRGDALFSVTFAGEEKQLAAAEAALHRELADIVQHGVSETELSRLRLQFLASQVFQQDSLFGQAMSLGQLNNLALTPRHEAAIFAALSQVGAQDLSHVVKKYLVDARLTRGRLQPQTRQ